MGQMESVKKKIPLKEKASKDIFFPLQEYLTWGFSVFPSTGGGGWGGVCTTSWDAFILSLQAQLTLPDANQ